MKNIIEVKVPKEARAWMKKCGEQSSPVLKEVELHVFRGATLYVGFDEEEQPLTYNVTRFGKRKKNVWEPYANWYTAYTPIIHRRKGFAKSLAQHVKKLAVDAGCVRLKALAGTKLGLLLHASLGDEFWGITEKLEVVVDTPLVLNNAYLNRTPPNATADAGIVPWTLEKVLEKLSGRELSYDCKRK